MKTRSRSSLRRTLIAVICACAVFGAEEATHRAEAKDLAAWPAGGLVTFTFDDAGAGIYGRAAPVLAAAGIQATYFSTSSYVDSPDTASMTWKQVVDLQESFGWEIGNHTRTHARLTDLTDREIVDEIQSSQRALRRAGIRPLSFSYPFGEIDDRVVDVVSDVFPVGRAAWGGMESGTLDSYRVGVERPRPKHRAARVIRFIKEAVRRDQWLVLNFHDIVEGQAGAFEYPVKELRRIVEYVAKRRIATATVAEALALESPNLVPDGDFDARSGPLPKGWLQEGKGIKAHRRNRGAYPSPRTSIRIVGGEQQRTILSPNVVIESDAWYALSWFSRIDNYVSGGHGFWLKEIDANGRLVSGQFVGGRRNQSIGGHVFLYRPSSASVRKVQLAAYANAGSQLDLYIDSIRLAKMTVNGYSSGSGARSTLARGFRGRKRNR